MSASPAGLPITRKAQLRALHDLRDVLDGTSLRGAARGAAYQLLETGAAFDRRAATAARQAPPLPRKTAPHSTPLA